MSHFLIYVFGPKPEEQLLPFDENTRDEKYIAFVENTQIKEEYERNEEIEVLVGSNGTIYAPWATYMLPKTGEVFKTTYMRCQSAYPTLQKYARGQHYATPDRKTGLYGHRKNPNGHWDYHTKMDGHFPLLPGSRHKTSASAKKCQIDFGKMRSNGDYCPAPFAYVMDGQWCARSRDAWEGDAYAKWVADFEKTLESVPDTTLITAFDCHT